MNAAMTAWLAAGLVMAITGGWLAWSYLQRLRARVRRFEKRVEDLERQVGRQMSRQLQELTEELNAQKRASQSVFLIARGLTEAAIQNEDRLNDIEGRSGLDPARRVRDCPSED